jgi:hypothetical protein
VHKVLGKKGRESFLCTDVPLFPLSKMSKGVMGETMNKRLAIIVAIFLLMFITAFSTAWAVSWGKLVYDTEVSSQTKENFQKAVDAVDTLFTKYKIVLSNPITMVVAANDSESYIRALMVYTHVSRAEAEDAVKRINLGQSDLKQPLAIIRYTPTRQLTPQGTSYLVNNPEEGFRVLPHEVWHQVKNQYSLVRTVNWLVEGPPELFKFMAFETAGIRRVTDSVQLTEQSIRRAAAIPDTRQLASYDYKTWQSLAQQRYPVYDMAALMTYRLVGGNGFEKLVFFYQLLHNGSDPDKAFSTAFGKQMSDFLAAMNDYFNTLRR